jgi:ribonuclease P protein component
MAGSAVRFGLVAAQRVRRKIEFDAAYKRGRRIADGVFSMTVCDSPTGHARIGLAIAARTVGNAVARNRLRRLIRESFRMAQHRLPPVDIIVGARNDARTATAAQRRASLDALWDKVIIRCAPRSG